MLEIIKEYKSKYIVLYNNFYYNLNKKDIIKIEEEIYLPLKDNINISTIYFNYSDYKSAIDENTKYIIEKYIRNNKIKEYKNIDDFDNAHKKKYINSYLA